MGNIGGEQVEKYLYETAISNTNDRVARTALFSLAKATGNRSYRNSTFLLDIVRKAKSPEVRKQALFQIASNRDNPEAVATLVKIAKESTDGEIQMVAIQVLGQSENDDAVPVLKDFAKNGVNKRVRSAAVTALGQIGTEKAKAALLEILGVKTKEE